jgi:hypothetical protein
MREALIDCCRLDWSKISPAIFGAMFQSVMDDAKRHDVGAHYTSEENILKLIQPLFLDNLKAELDKIKILKSDARIVRLEEFHNKLANLKFLDPACGCGNFLVISYRELRLLELDVLKELLKSQKLLDIHQYIKVNVNQFYGIEIEEFPAQVAQTAMWLMDHQMNMQVREQFGEYFIRIPLTTSASICCANALTIDWETVVPKSELSYILGNPPFLGAAVMSKEQKKDLELVFNDVRNCNNLDYVTCWYKKAARYIQEAAKSGKNIEVAFVSTNSICQGEQVPVLWSELIRKYGVKINFAHQTFKWSNEARGKAAVYCIIVGFGLFDRTKKRLYQYATITGKPSLTIVDKINAYLTNADMIFIEKRSSPICKDVSEMNMGSAPIDDGNFLLTQQERTEILKNDPSLKELMRPFVAAEEFLHNQKKYCIWLFDISPALYQHSKEIKSRIQKVANYRKNSKRKATQKRSDYPSLFSEIRQPNSNYLLIPRVSSEQRKYIPVGFMKKNIIAGDTTLIIPGATLYEFGIITSTMHMAWVRYVCGRLKSDYRYSASIVYNNFPWPTPTEKQKLAIETEAKAVLEARENHKDMNLAAMYASATMPPDLTKAHNKLDKLVEKAYGREFNDDAQRVAYLFELYQTKSGELFVDTQKRGKGRKAP